MVNVSTTIMGRRMGNVQRIHSWESVLRYRRNTLSSRALWAERVRYIEGLDLTRENGLTSP